MANVLIVLLSGASPLATGGQCQTEHGGRRWMHRKHTLAVGRSDLCRLRPHICTVRSWHPLSASTVGSSVCRWYGECCPPGRRSQSATAMATPWVCVRTRPEKGVHPHRSDPARDAKPQRLRPSTQTAFLAPPTVNRWSGSAVASERSRIQTVRLRFSLPPSPDGTNP